MAPLPGVVGHSGLQPHWLVRSKARSLDKAVTPVPLAPPYHAHPFRPSAGTSARRPRSLWPSGDDTGGAAALDPRALGTTGAPEPLFHHNHCMLAQDVGWFRAARQAATEGLVTAPARLVGEVSFRVGGNTEKKGPRSTTKCSFLTFSTFSKFLQLPQTSSSFLYHLYSEAHSEYAE